jgi:hypothetical protein
VLDAGRRRRVKAHGIFLSPIFFPILAFGSSRYVGTQSGASGMPAPALA